MDPDTCLNEIRSLVQRLDDPDESDTVEVCFERLVQLVDGLDTWMSLGGYPPRPWQPEGRQRTRPPVHEPGPAGDVPEEGRLDDL